MPEGSLLSNNMRGERRCYRSAALLLSGLAIAGESSDLIFRVISEVEQCVCHYSARCAIDGIVPNLIVQHTQPGGVEWFWSMAKIWRIGFYLHYTVSARCIVFRVAETNNAKHKNALDIFRNYTDCTSVSFLDRARKSSVYRLPCFDPLMSLP